MSEMSRWFRRRTLRKPRVATQTSSAGFLATGTIPPYSDFFPVADLYAEMAWATSSTNVVKLAFVTFEGNFMSPLVPRLFTAVTRLASTCDQLTVPLEFVSVTM